MKLAYQAFDQSGQLISGVIDANDSVEATERLHRNGVFISQIHEVSDESVKPKRSGVSRFGHGKRLKILAFFSRQLYVLISNGTPLAEALEAAQRQAKDEEWQSVITDIITRVKSGSSLSKAMAQHPAYFDDVYRNLIEVGETGGNFGPMLERLADLTQKKTYVRGQVLAAMIYPALLIVVSLAVLGVMLLVVLPRFVELFETLDVALPPTTAALVWLSGMLQSYWWLGIGVIVGLPIGIKKLLSTPGGKRVLDTAVLRLPQIGPITRSFASASIARLLGVLLESHVPLVDALGLCQRSVRNGHYATLLTTAQENVTRGEPISSAFADETLIVGPVYEAIRIGERSGQVGHLLLNIAGFLDDENNVVLRGLTSILEPLILIVLGVLVGFVAVSMFLPLFDLTSMASGGAS